MVLVAKQTLEQPVEHGVAGSAALEDAVEPGAQDLSLFGARRELVFLERTIEPPDHLLGDFDGVSLLVIGGNELVDEPFGVNPAQGVHAEAKLAGVVGNDDRIPQQALMMDRAPQRRLAGDQDGIGQDFHLAQAQRLQMALPVLRGRENARLMLDELVDHAGWEKGQVENQVGLVRERFFTPRLRFKSYDELNGWLVDKCVVWAKAHAHPEQSGKTIWEAFEDERPKLIPYGVRFDGFHALPASVSKTCLVRFDNNKYSVSASAVGRPVEIHAYADRIVIRQDGRIVAEHQRSFGRGRAVYDPWHYVPVLARKPGALRNGAPFRDWVLPGALERVRRKLAGSNDGDRQMVKILAAVLTDGMPEVEAACAQALSEGVHSADVVLNILARRRDPGPAATIMTPANLRLVHMPVADCARYDALRSA